MSAITANKRIGALLSQVTPSDAVVVTPSSVPSAAAAAATASAADVKTNATNGSGSGSGADFDFTKLENIRVEKRGRVAIVMMYRPSALNALSDALVSDVSTAFSELQSDIGVGCIVLTGTGRAFAAGADIKEMKSSSFYSISTRDKLGPWRGLSEVKLPVIAAVNGLALGGGCEIAMMCDIILASDKAQFGQPEIKLGILPGAGGTQRLPRFIGKSKAMELCLTGNMMSAADAEKYGLVSRVVPHDQLLDVAVKMATTIANYSRPSVILTKEAVATAYETTLATGLQYERRLFQMTWGYDDAREGTAAFAEKRPANFKHK